MLTAKRLCHILSWILRNGRNHRTPPAPDANGLWPCNNTHNRFPINNCWIETKVAFSYLFGHWHLFNSMYIRDEISEFVFNFTSWKKAHNADCQWKYWVIAVCLIQIMFLCLFFPKSIQHPVGPPVNYISKSTFRKGSGLETQQHCPNSASSSTFGECHLTAPSMSFSCEQ